jgi:XTP/dITP diphosphohydrolase
VEGIIDVFSGQPEWKGDSSVFLSARAEDFLPSEQGPMPDIDLVLATHNEGKKREYYLLFKDFPIEIRTLSEFDWLPEVKEVGTSFEEIAKGKARHAAVILGISAISDDSGLEVEALDGAPGILSARYAGEPANDAANNRKLLEAMRGRENRRASFMCAIAIAKPSGQVRVYTGRCRGEISHEPRGVHGFGYDPLFLYPPYGRTFAELPEKDKSEVSHRGRAMRRLRDDFDAIVTWLEAD